MLLCRPAGVGGVFEVTMRRKRAKKKTFSVVKAVRANARERVGQPKAERVLEDAPREEKRGRKHAETLSSLLRETEE